MADHGRLLTNKIIRDIISPCNQMYLELFVGDKVEEIGLVLLQSLHHIPHFVLLSLFRLFRHLLLLQAMIETSVVDFFLWRLHRILGRPNLGNTALSLKLAKSDGHERENLQVVRATPATVSPTKHFLFVTA